MYFRVLKIYLVWQHQLEGTIFFDFDSTLTRVEGLDVLAKITLANNPKKDEIIQEIINITNQGIDGDISFTESLEKRIKLLHAKKSDLPLLVTELKKHVSKSIERNKEFLTHFQTIFLLFQLVLKNL